MRRRNVVTMLVVSMSSVAMVSTVGPVSVEAGKAVPSVTISSCQITQDGGSIGGGVVTASGSWSGLRAGSIVSARIVVTQSADAGAARRAYTGSGPMALTTSTRTSGTLDVSSGGIDAYEGFPSWLEPGYAYGHITLNLPRGGTVSSDTISCTVVP